MTTEAAGQRAERQVATLFGVSMLATVAFIVAYFAIDYTATSSSRDRHSQPVAPRPRRDDGVSLLGIGFGAVHWAKAIMPDEEIVEERHLQRSSDATRKKAADLILGGGEMAQLGRRPLHQVLARRRTGPLRTAFVVQVAGSLGNPTQISELAQTLWDVPKNPTALPARRSG
jgi:ubiquinol-cytochrome c reductase iron-sulfur subunit